jgi:hypothetical protein
VERFLSEPDEEGVPKIRRVIESLYEKAVSGDKVAVAAAKELIDRGFGKATQQVNVSSEVVQVNIRKYEPSQTSE